MGLPVWRNPEEKSSSALGRVKNDITTAASRSPIRRLRASRPTSFHRPTSHYRLGQPPPVPEAPQQHISIDDDHRRYFDLSAYLRDPEDHESRRSRRPANFLPPPIERDRPQSRNGLLSSLPTPSLDVSEPSAHSRIVLLRPSQPSPHPLSFAHRPLSPDDGLGDRDRSPSPVPDAWHVIGSTITPDDSLPSANSSFASNNASASFRLAHDSTQPTSQSDESESPVIFTSHPSSSNTHSSSQHPDRRTIEALLYDLAMQTAEGRAQIQLIRRMSPEDASWMRHHGSQDQENDAGNQDEAPSRRPSQYDSEIRERTRQVAASTLRFFGSARPATDTPPRSPSPSPRVARHSGDQTYRRTDSFLTRSIRDAAEGRERRQRDERL